MRCNSVTVFGVAEIDVNIGLKYEIGARYSKISGSVLLLILFVRI